MERSRIRVILMDNLNGLLGIRRIDKIPNAQVRELYKVKRGMKVFFGGFGIRK